MKHSRVTTLCFPCIGIASHECCGYLQIAALLGLGGRVCFYKSFRSISVEEHRSDKAGKIAGRIPSGIGE